VICRISDKSSTLDAIKLPGKTDNLIKKMDAIIFFSLFFRLSDPNAVFTMNFLFPPRQTETSELLGVQHFRYFMETRDRTYTGQYNTSMSSTRKSADFLGIPNVTAL